MRCSGGIRPRRRRWCCTRAKPGPMACTFSKATWCGSACGSRAASRRGCARRTIPDNAARRHGWAARCLEVRAMRHLSIPVLLIELLAASCASVVNPVTGQAERTVMDEAAEVAEGKKAHPQVLAEYGSYNNPRVQAYVNDVGQRLARQSHRANLQWTFTVLDSPEINAFALPG